VNTIPLTLRSYYKALDLTLYFRKTISMIKKLKIFTLLFFFVAVAAESNAQQRGPAVKTRILFIFDMSNSMNANWKKEKKVVTAKAMLSKLVDSLRQVPNLEMALRIYGHQSPVPPQDCSDTKLEVPFSKNNADRIIQKLKYTKARGTTPIARSLLECSADFPHCNNCKNVVILITDGIEACDGDPCEIAMSLLAKGVTLKPFVIGIGLDLEAIDAFKCMGKVYNAGNEEQLGGIMQRVVSKSMYGTTSQISLLNTAKQPKESNVNITLYDQNKNTFIKNFIHTLNEKGNPDTLSLSTDITYKITVHTIPPVTVSNIKIRGGKHNVIKANTPQGTLNVTQARGGRELNGIKFIVRQSGKPQTLHVQKINTPEKFITGAYDLEILTLPRIYKKGVVISQSKKTEIKVPQPGMANLKVFTKGFGGLYLKKGAKVSHVYTFGSKLSESVQLQPGNYVAVYRPAKQTSTQFSKEIHFKIESGRSTNVYFK